LEYKDSETLNKYEIIIYRSELYNAYVAEVPELAGCMADGKTYAEALYNAETIINSLAVIPLYYLC